MSACRELARRLDDRDDPWATPETEPDDDHDQEGTPMHRMKETPVILRRPIAHVAWVLRRYLSAPDLGCTSAALEATRNIVAGLAWQPASGAAWVIERDAAVVADVVEEALLHRVRHGWLSVRAVDEAVALAVVAWARATRPEAGVEQREAA
jgi:hypothetical protein